MKYTVTEPVSVDQFRDVLVRSTLGERRPIHDLACLQNMIEKADLIATCWDGELLIGIARSLTDFQYCCYLSDLAVDVTYQRRGIGRELIRRTQAALGPRCQIILLAAPAAVDYYPHLGFEQHPSCWILPRLKSV